MPLVGTIVNVHDSVDGSELVADATATDTSITVADVDLDFNLDPEGGQLKIDDGTNSEIWSYTIPAGSTGEIDLVGGGLAHSYVTGTRVEVYPRVVERWADIVEPDGEEPLRCLVSHQLRPLIPLGPRNLDDGTAENVYCERQDGDMVIQNVLGQAPTVEAPIHATGLDLDEFVVGLPNQELHEVRWLDADGVRQARMFEQDSAPGKALGAFVGDTSQVGVTFVYLAGSSFIRLKVEGATVDILDDSGASDFEFDTSAGWQNWTPTFTGYSSTPTSGVYRYKQTGKTVQVAIRQPNNGTSNNVAKSISLPVTAAAISGMEWRGSCGAVDNGVALATPSRARIASSGTVISLDKDFSNTDGWTASGSHRITGLELFYEAA